MNDWIISPENAKPIAKDCLKNDFFWENADDNSPLGNDTGSDVFHHYQKWIIQKPLTKATDFLKKTLSSWELENKDWDLLEENKLQSELEKDSYNVLVRDDVIIALAFSQIIIEGLLNQEIKQLALLAIRRQMSDIVINFRDWEDKQERKESLLIMQNVLQNFNEQIEVN